MAGARGKRVPAICVVARQKFLTFPEPMELDAMSGVSSGARAASARGSH